MDGPPIAPEQLIALRHDLHREPELSGHEAGTAERIRRHLVAFEPDELIVNLGGHGVAAVFGVEAYPCLLVRCELDALPIAETNTFSHRSTRPDVSHKCGHDGHMAILSGVAERLRRRAPGRGRVVLLFQPAEETGAGARRVLDDPRFTEIRPDSVAALHNLPGYPAGTVLCRPGTFSAAVTSLAIELHGRTAHAAEPEQGINPARTIAEILSETAGLERPASDPSFALVTPIQVAMGAEAYGVSAGSGIVRLTLRTWDNPGLERLRSEVEAIARRASARHGVRCAVSWVEPFAATVNDERMVDVIRGAARESGLPFVEMEAPVRFGEDFGLFTGTFPGAMFGLGAGETTPALHDPEYDFPDALIPVGIAMFDSIIRRLLG